MRIEELDKYAPQALIEKHVSWQGPGPDGDGEYDGVIRVRRLSFGDAEMLGRDAKDENSFAAKLIVACLVFEDDKRLGYEQAYNLPPSMGQAFLSAILDVNPLLAAEKN